MCETVWDAYFALAMFALLGWVLGLVNMVLRQRDLKSYAKTLEEFGVEFARLKQETDRMIEANKALVEESRRSRESRQ